MEELISYNATLNQETEKSNLDAMLGLTNPLGSTLDPKPSVGSVSNLVTPSDLANDQNITTSISGLNSNEINNEIWPFSSTNETSVSSSGEISKSSTDDPEIDALTGVTVSEALVDNSLPDSLTNPSASETQTLPDIKTNILTTSESFAPVSLNAEQFQANTDSTNKESEQAKENITPTTSHSNTPEASITSNENVALASTSNITDSSQTPTNTNVPAANSSTPPLISTENQTLIDSTNSIVTPDDVTATTTKDSRANSPITSSINSTTVDVSKTKNTTTNSQNLTQPISPSFSFDTGVFKVDETGIVGIDYLFDGGGYEGELGIFSLEGMEELAQNSHTFIIEAARRAASSSNLGYVVITDATEGARFSGNLPYNTNLNKGQYKGVKTFTMRPGDTFGVILVPNRATLQQVANNSARGDDTRPLFSLPMANPNGGFMTGQIADVTGVGNTFVMEDWRIDKSSTDRDYNDIIFQVRGATGSAVSIDSVINPKKEWRSSDLGKALIEYAKAYVTPENPKIGELVTDELYDSVFGKQDNQVDNPSTTGSISPEVPKSDTPVVTTAPATSDPPKTETGATSTNSGAIAPTTEEPSVSVEGSSPVADKTVVTSESENQSLDSVSTTPISPQQPVVTTEFSSSVTVSDAAPKNPDSTVVIDEDSGASAVNPTSTTTPNSVTADNSISNVTGDNGGAITKATQNNNSASTTQPIVAKTVAIEGEQIGTITQHSVEPEIAVVGVTKNPENLSNNEVAVTATVTSSSENTGVDATSDLADNWLSQLNQELKNLDSQVQGELATLKNTISTTTGSVNSQVQKLGERIAETQESLNTSVESTGNEVSGIKKQMNSSVTSTGGQLDAIEKTLNDQLTGIADKLSDGQTQLNSGVNGLSTQLTNDAASMNGKVNEAKNKVWSNPTDAFTELQQDHVVETVEHHGDFDIITTHIGGTPEQKQQIYTDTSKLQTDRTNAINAVETAKNDAVNSAQTQFNTLSADKDKVIADAQAKLAPLTQAKDAAIKEVESVFADITASISDIDKKFAGVQALKDLQFAIAYANFNAIEALKNEVLTNTQEQFNALSNSWSDWVKDTKEQINVWTKITDSEDRWFNTTPTNPALKVGLPLIGVVDTGFSANNSDLDYSRITLGKDWVDGDDNPLMLSGEGKEHGTQILEIIGATRNNGIGINGINDKSPLWLGRAVGSNNWAQSLIEFVDAAKASKEPNAVVNLSFDLTQTNPDGSVTTRYELTPVERAALTYAKQNNILIITSTGNQGSTMSALAQATKEFDNIFVVGAAEEWQRANYSSYGEVDYANYGKGVDILAQGSASNGASGTSVAAAKVTGAASLVWAANPGLNHAQVMDILRRTATDLNTPNWDAETGMGLLNIAAAVHLAKATKPEVYVSREFQLVQETLKAYQIPEVHWPQFYEYYYRAELETKFTGSQFINSAWTDPAWNVSPSIIGAERATAKQRVEKVFDKYWSGSIFEPDVPGLEDRRNEARTIANEHRKNLSLPDLVYVRYEVDFTVEGWTENSGRVHVWKVIDWDAKADYERKLNELNTAKAFVEQKNQEILAAKAATQKEIDALTAKIVATERELRVAINIAEKGKSAYVEELNARLAEVEKNAEQSKQVLQKELDRLEEKRAELQQKLNSSPFWWVLYQSEIREIDRSIRATENSIRNLEQPIKAAEQDLLVANNFDSQSSQSSKIEDLKNQLSGLKTQLKTTQEKADNLIENLKTQLKDAEKDLSDKTKVVEDTVKTAKDDLDKEIKAAEAAIEARKKGFFDKLGDSVKQFSKDLGEKLKSSLDGIDIGAVLDALKKIPYVGTVVNGIEGLIALVQGDWKEVVKSGVNGVLKIIPGGSAVPEPLVNILIDVGWAIVNKDYQQGLKNILEELAETEKDKKIANVFVDVAWAMKDGDWKKALSEGLSGVNFKNADKFVDVAWAIKDGDYKKALSTGLSTTGFPNADKFVDVAWAVKEGDYKKALSAGLEAANLGNAGTFVGNVFDAITADYSLPGQSIDPAAIPQKHKQYEYLARGIAYEDPEVSAIAEEAFKDDSNSGKKLAVGEKVLKSGYEVNKVISDPNTGFYAVGLVSTDGSKPPVLAVRGTGGSPTEGKGPAFLKDVLEDANPLGIGYGQFQAHKHEIEAWLATQNSQGQRPDIVGHSLGGALAQTISAEFADKVGETVTFNSPGIETSTVLKFGLNGGNPENVTHYVVSGDIVQMAGEAFLPGKAVLSSYSNPFVWEKHGLSVLNGAEIKGEQKASGVKFSSLSVLELSNPAFHYRELDYTLFLAALSAVPVSTYVSASLSTRGTAEANRKAIGAFLNSNFQTIQNWVDTAWSIKNGDYLKALSTGFGLANFQDGKKWVDMVQSVKSGDYLKALSTGFDVAKFQDGKNWVDMAWSLQKGDYLKALSTGFKVAEFPEGEHLVKAAVNLSVNLREGKYLDAFFEGIRLVPGVGDLINAFQAIGNGNFKGVANSLAKVATNPRLRELLVS